MTTSAWSEVNVRDMLTWTRERLLEHQWQRLRAITRHAYDRSAMYRRLWDRGGVTPDDITSLADIGKLPLITKQDFAQSQENRPPYSDNLTVLPHTLVRTHLMPGPTGNALLVDPVTAHDVDMAINIGELLYRIAGVTEDDVAINTRPFGFSPAGLFMQQALERIGANTCAVAIDQGQRAIDAITLLRPSMIEAFTTQCVSLGRLALSHGIDPAKQWGVRTLVIGGEPGGGAPAVRRELAQIYGNPQILEYGGTVETRMVFMECREHAGLHAAEPFTLIEVLNPESLVPSPPGEPGLLVLTSLYREGYPVIRYNTGDIVRLVPQRCACGLHFQRIGGYLGRYTSVVRAGGRNQFPEPLTAAMKEFSEVTSFQVFMSRESEAGQDRIDIRLESAQGLSSERLREIEEKMLSVMTPDSGVCVRAEQVTTGTLPHNARFNVIVDERKGLYEFTRTA